jgi:hypothetical protein
VWDDQQISVQMGWIAEVDLRNARVAKGLDEMRQSLAASRRSWKAAPNRTSTAVEHLHHLLRFADDPNVPASEARAMYQEALPIATAYTAGHPTVLSSQVDEARAHVGLARLAREAHDRAALDAESGQARPHFVRLQRMLDQLDSLRT